MNKLALRQEIESRSRYYSLDLGDDDRIERPAEERYRLLDEAFGLVDFTDKHVLELGCTFGTLHSRLTKTGFASASCVDYGREEVEVTRLVDRYFGDDRFRVETCDVDRDPLRPLTRLGGELVFETGVATGDHAKSDMRLVYLNDDSVSALQMTWLPSFRWVLDVLASTGYEVTTTKFYWFAEGRYEPTTWNDGERMLVHARRVRETIDDFEVIEGGDWIRPRVPS